MPIRIRKLAGGGWRVTDGGKVTAKRTSKRKAQAQARILRTGLGGRTSRHPYVR